MKTNSEINSWNIAVKSFYDRFYKIEEFAQTELCDRNYQLKQFLLEKLHTQKEENARRRIRNQINNYYKTLTDELRSSLEGENKAIITSSNPGVNAWNIFCTSKDSMCPTRLTLFEIAFTLGLNGEECNKMLRSAGHYDIHLGGDPQESIIYFCLDKGLSHLDAIKMYEQFCMNQLLVCVSEDYQKTISQRSVFIAKELLKAINMEHFDSSKAAFEEKLRLYAASYSYYCGRVRRYFLKLTDAYMKEGADQFRNDFCLMFHRVESGVKLEFGKILDEKSHPTRECVCLTLCLDYYKNYSTNSKLYSLEEFINNNLASFGIEELNDIRLLDALLIELSQYQLDTRTTKAVKHSNGLSFAFPYTGKDYIRQVSEILKCYCTMDYCAVEPITRAKLIDKNSFLQDLFLKTPGDKNN